MKEVFEMLCSIFSIHFFKWKEEEEEKEKQNKTALNIYGFIPTGGRVSVSKEHDICNDTS